MSVLHCYSLIIHAVPECQVHYFFAVVVGHEQRTIQLAAVLEQLFVVDLRVLVQAASRLLASPADSVGRIDKPRSALSSGITCQRLKGIALHEEELVADTADLANPARQCFRVPA